MADVTLTAAMRATLYSLQQTAQLMGTTQSRLSTGKKVNSALDDPNNYFIAQALTDRASDIDALLDGMSQGIQTIKVATQGIEAAQEMVDQMKAIAKLAKQDAGSTSSGGTTDLAATGTLDTDKVITDTSNTQLLTNLKNNSTDASAGVVVGDTLVVTTAEAHTFTVTETSTVDDLNDFIEGLTSDGDITAAVMSTDANGAIELTITGTTTLLSGNLQSSLLGTTSTATGAETTGTVALATGPTLLADLATGGTANNLIALTSLVDSSGVSLGISIGDTLTFKSGDEGTTYTFTVGGDVSRINDSVDVNKNAGGTTLKDLQDWLEVQDTANDLTISSGKVSFTNLTGGTTESITLGGDLATALGIDGATAEAATTTGTDAVYSLNQYAPTLASSSTLLRDLTGYNGQFYANGNTQVGDYLQVVTTTGTATIEFTEGMTVADLMTAITAVDADLTVTLSSSGQFIVDNQTSGAVSFYTGATGTTASALFADPTGGASDATFATNTAGNALTSTRVLYAGFEDAGTGTAGSSVIDATKKDQFDTALESLDALINDTDYQGVNLISGSDNSPLTITFSEKATGASKLTISAVDLSSTGLGIMQANGTATGAWETLDDLDNVIETLTAASTTLREQAATFGYNLTTVQNRQDFAENIIATLKEGADKLTLADMNEEGANMLALQTRSQLGTQSLSLASQANQAVMRLFA